MKKQRSVDMAGRSLVLIFVLLSSFSPWLALPKQVVAQIKAQPESSPNPQPQNQPVATSSPAPVAAIPVPQIVPWAQELIEQLREMDESLTHDPTPDAIDQTLKTQEGQIGKRQLELDELIRVTPTIIELQDVEQEWLAQKELYATTSKTLTKLAEAVGENVGFLESRQAEWETTLKQILASKELKTIVERIREVLGEIQTTKTHALELLATLLSLQDRVSQQNQLVLDALKKIAQTKARLKHSLLDPDSPPLWNAGWQGPAARPFDSLVKSAFSRNFDRTQEFIRAKRHVGSGILALFLVMLAIHFVFRRRILRWIAAHPDFATPTHSFNRPVSLALLTILLVMLPLMTALPVQLRMLVIILFVPPVLRLLAPQIKPVFHALLHVLIVFGLTAWVWETIDTSQGIKRWGLATLSLVAISLGVWLTRRVRRQLQLTDKQARRAIIAVWLSLGLIMVSLAANVLGYVGLSRLLRSGTIISIYSAIVLYTAYLVVANVLSALFLSRQPDSLSNVRAQTETLVRWTLRLMSWAAFCLWAYTTLGVFTIRKPVMGAISFVLTTPIKLRAASFTFGDVLTFILVLLAGIGLAGIIRIVLRDAWLQRLNLTRGIPHAISTITYYLLLLLVFLLALSASGVELSKFTVLTGAFGIGAGFGLQNVISNFVSGIILLFERPIRIGDFLEIDRALGEVVRMGMRSSSMRTPQGAEVIVPNSNLISNQVINWTLTEQKRRTELRFKVAYGEAPKRVSELLIETALAHPDVLRDPRPRAFFQGFGDNSLDFELQFWVPKTVFHLTVSSEIAIQIVHQFQEAGIRIPAPRRELYVTGMASGVKELLASAEPNPKGHPHNNPDIPNRAAAKE
jgi:potassium efflux system protein